MIVKKHFIVERRKNGESLSKIEYEGWYLFGFIPLYVKKTWIGVVVYYTR